MLAAIMKPRREVTHATVDLHFKDEQIIHVSIKRTSKGKCTYKIEVHKYHKEDYNTGAPLYDAHGVWADHHPLLGDVIDEMSKRLGGCIHHVAEYYTNGRS